MTGEAPAPGNDPPRAPVPPVFPQEPSEGFTAVGRVARAHGLRGELRVAVFAAGAPNLQPGRRVYLGGRAHVIVRSRPSGDAWIVELRGLSGRDAAEAWRGALLECPDADVQRADGESYFVHELVGLRVMTAAGREVGTLVEVMQTGANDVYIVRGAAGEVLVPAIGEFVASIDVPAGVVTITPLPGMLDEGE